ncbi:unnamed protein product [Chrysoparadoxa australica]
MDQKLETSSSSSPSLGRKQKALPGGRTARGQGRKAQSPASPWQGGRKHASKGYYAANDLLNFNYERRAQTQNYEASRSGGGKGRRKRTETGWRQHSGGCINKEQFVQANFKFIYLPKTQALHESFYDADAVVDWARVESVQLAQDVAKADHRCPVCLEGSLDMTCPRVTRCGHVYCFTCILRHLEGEAEKGCPMCQARVTRNDLRRAAIKTVKVPQPGAQARFLLLNREKGSLLLGRAKPKPRSRAGDEGETKAELAANHRAERDGLAWPLEGSQDGEFMRLVRGNPVLLAQRLLCEDQELDALRVQAIKEGFTECLPFVAEAKALLCDERERCLDGGELLCDESDHRKLGDSSAPTEDTGLTLPAATAEPFRSVARNEVTEEAVMDEAAAKDEKETKEGEVTKVEVVLRGDASPFLPSSSSPQMMLQLQTKSEGEQPPPPPRTTTPSPTTTANVFEFYQIQDGQPCFLHPINIKCLLYQREQELAAYESHLQAVEAQQLLGEIEGLAPPLPLPPVPQLPAYVSGNVLEIEPCRVTREMVKRFPFLSHMPEYSDILLVELDLSDMLSDAVVAKFKPELVKRSKKRRNSAMARRSEKHAELLAIAEARDKRAALLAATVDLGGPVVGGSIPSLPTEEDSAEATETNEMIQGDGLGEDSTPLAPLDANGEEWSFARVTAMGGNFPSLSGGDAFPMLTSSGAGVTAAAGEGTNAWGAGKDYGSLAASEDRRNDWGAAVGDALAAATTVNEEGDGSGVGKGKKKKKKKVNLLSNSQQRRR